MRKLVYAINITLDGCCDHTKMMAPGLLPEHEQLQEYYIALLREMELSIYGRKTYQLMVPYWPDIAKSHSETKEENDFADAFESVNRVVFSRTLESADEKTRIVRGSLRGEIVKLKQEAGGNILAGGVSLPAQLAELGLIDEYRFVVQPVVAGEGRRLLEGLPQRLQLKLVETKSFGSGCVALRYVKQ
jgi:dihydrofolate reductase